MTRLRTAALALTGILALSVASAPSASAQWRGHHGGHWGPGIGLGIAAGALVGAAVASRPYGYGYYGDGYYGEPGYVAGPGYVYDAPYAYGPGYSSYPGYYGGYYGRKCYTDEGYGRRRACDYGGQ